MSPTPDGHAADGSARLVPDYHVAGVILGLALCLIVGAVSSNSASPVNHHLKPQLQNCFSARGDFLFRRA